MKLAGFVCNSARQSLAAEAFICQNVHDRRSSKSKSPKICNRWSKQMIYLCWETHISKKKLNCSCFYCYHIPKYFFSSHQNFDASLKYIQVETVFDQEETQSHWTSAKDPTLRDQGHLSFKFLKSMSFCMVLSTRNSQWEVWKIL